MDAARSNRPECPVIPISAKLALRYFYDRDSTEWRASNRSFIFVVYIILLPKFMEKLDAPLITIAQFAFAGTYALIFSLLFEDNSNTVWNYQSVFTLVYLTVLCTALCVLLQAVITA